MYISSLKTTSAPYLFEQNQVDATVNKSGEENNSVGRSANITSNNSLFYCTIKDIIVDGEKINFVEFDEEKEISTRKIAEDYLETEEFTVNKDVDFTFKLTSGSTENDDTKSVIAKDNYVNFIVELLNAKDNSVIDVLTKVNFDKSSSLKMEEKSYEVDAKNIKADKVKIRITVEENIKGNLTIADIISDNRELPKQGYEKIELLKKEVITDYSLAQNYPNPFNPVTTINYKIPNNGIVSLKVYDVLGEEVATLVNEYKTTGSYNVKFDGSNLTSGIYIYTIKAGDFKDTKKLMLMK
ncbi:MAG: hypothetical protein CR986_10630 [Ignavibacteriae bacterium]|nr:MAG: hypothetical protein CR986_10630 [Ignavibacteriota bacterium]